MVTIKDIAKKSGFSITTVSRALNNHSDVKYSTKKKVVQIARELNYQPNSSARSLVLNKTNTIGLIISGLSESNSSHHVVFDMICGITDQANLNNYDVVLYGTTSKDQKEITYLDLCLQRKFDGVILYGVRIDDPYVQQIVDAHVPTILIDVPLVSTRCGSVGIDDIQGAKLAVQHLVDYGHRHILFINGIKEAKVSLSRLEGYIKALNENDIPYREEYVVFADFEIKGASKAIENLLSTQSEATAVFCASDLMAYGVIQRVQDLGYRVPEDISVIGFDGIQLGEIMKPSLTTIFQDRYAKGTSAVNLLVELLNGNSGYSRVLPPRLIVRESTSSMV